MFTANLSNTDQYFFKLQNNLQLIFTRIEQVNERFTELSVHPETVIEQAYLNYWVSASTVPLLREVKSQSELLPDSILKEQLIQYVTTHIEEEIGHDEWALDDLEVFGEPRDKVFARIPSHNVANLIGSQYYWIRHYHPVAYMGYLACLEVRHPTMEYVNTLMERSGLPKEGFSSMKHHAVADIGHSEDIINTINNFPLTPEQYQVMENSAFHTARYAALCMEDVCNAAKK